MGRSGLALLLLVPAPSIGTAAAMLLFPGSWIGTSLFMASKAWLFLFPAVWLKLVEKGRFSLSPIRQGGIWQGLFSGLGLSAVILIGCFTVGLRIFDRAFFVERMNGIGLGTWQVYVGGAAYWILVNSVLEEYVWRWFVYEKCRAIAPPAVAVVLSALFFTLHHFIALKAYCSLPVAAIGSLGVFVGGMVWSALYRRYGSIWPGYASHALVDLAVFGFGAYLLFGRA